MDAVSYSLASKQAQRIEKFIENPDSTSGIVTVPKTIASGETITIPAGRVAILPNVQIDGVLNVENDGEVFIPSGATLSTVVEKVTSTDNAIVRFDGTTGEVQNSGVIIDDNGNVGIGQSNPTTKLEVIGNIKTACSGVAAVNTRGITWAIDGSVYGRLAVDNSGSLLYIGSGGLGYGTGSGGTVTQVTSKSTAVTLNKPTGIITTSNSALVSGQGTSFTFLNSLLGGNDNLKLTPKGTTNYDIDITDIYNGAAVIRIINRDSISHSDAISINFSIIKGANS